jgi:hypothetical protein
VKPLVAQNRKTEFIPFDPYRMNPHWRRGIQTSPAVTIADAAHVTLSCRSKRNKFRFTDVRAFASLALWTVE